MTGPGAILVLCRRRLRAPLIIEAEAVHLSADGIADFDALHSRSADEEAVACASDLLLSGDDIRRQPLTERKNALRWVLRKSREGIQYVEHTEDASSALKGWSERLDTPYRSGRARSWIKVKNPKAAAVTRVLEGGGF